MTRSDKSSKKSRNPWVVFSHWVDNTLVSAYYHLGHAIADHPIKFIIIPILIVALLCIGIVNFAVENDGDELYTPQDSVGFEHRDLVEASFGFEDAYSEIFFAAKANDHSNILTKQSLLDTMTAFEILKSVSVTSEGQVKTFENTCRRIPNNSSQILCDITSVLDFWSYNRTKLELDNDVISTINLGLSNNVTDAFGRVINPSIIFGGLEMANGMIAKATAFRMTFYMTTTTARVDGNVEFDQPLVDFDVEVSKQLRSQEYSVLQVAPHLAGDAQKVSEDAINADVGLLIPGYVILIVFAFGVMWRRSWVGSYASMAFISILAIVLAIGAALGLGLAVGVPFSLVVQALAFLLLGLGVDDSFVIMATHGRTDSNLPVRERMARTLARAGVSITITSLTDIVAFAVGTITSLPAIRDFCIYASIGVLFDFFLQITFFCALLAINTKREKSGRADMISCYEPQDPEAKCCSSEKFDPNGKTSGDILFGEWLPSITLHPAGKIVVILIALGLSGTAIWASQQVTDNFEIEWFTPSDSHLWDAYNIRDDHFGSSPLAFAYYTQAVDYPNLQPEMQAAITDLEGLSVITRCDSWWTYFSAWMVATKGVAQAPPADFYPWLNEFLNTHQGSVFSSQIIFDNTTNLIKMTESFCVFGDISEDSIGPMNEVREVADNHPDMDGFSYTFVFLFFDGQAVIKWETLRNIIVAGAAVAVVTFILLANFMTSLCVLVMLILTDLNVLAMMYYTNVDFNSVSAINLVIAVGLAIDSSVHIAHAFLSSHGTRNERAHQALQKLGKSAFQGIFSTFLAVVLLIFAKSYIFQVFFKLLATILLFAFFHGVILLPVILSLVGPAPYPAWEVDGATMTDDDNDEVGNDTKQQSTPVTDFHDDGLKSSAIEMQPGLHASVDSSVHIATV